jgi:hypothetical protein
MANRKRLPNTFNRCTKVSQEPISKITQGSITEISTGLITDGLRACFARKYL